MNRGQQVIKGSWIEFIPVIIEAGGITGGAFASTASCEVFGSEVDFNKEMNRLRDEYQAQYDKKREGNVL